jgi:cellulose synthase/poly-beta-1,6-N-acetylglucosamine synthase-like glycosyltransferase
MIGLLLFFSWFLCVYYGVANFIYLVLLVFSLIATANHHRRIGTLLLNDLRRSPLTPPVSILVPARNEENSIVESVRSLLALDYPELEVVVVNDGSTDRTLDELQKHFGLLHTDILYIPEIPTRPVRAVYMSTCDRRLLVLDKESCGRKADALNAALNAASCPYVCAVDADAVLERDALLRIIASIVDDPHKVIASGGIVRVVNGSRVKDGVVQQIRLPRRLIEVLQVIEYLRAFLIGRQAWAHFNLLIIISGAFGIFRRDICKAIGGFRVSAIGEDMDLVVRMHRYMLRKKQDYKISFVPDPVCWTEAPSSVKALARQRARWQNGLADVLCRNRDMLFNSRFGRIGLLALLYQWLFEYLAPAVEVLGWTSIILAGILGVLDRFFLTRFLILGYLFGTLISIGSVVLEEMTYHRYNDPRDLLKLIAACFFEMFPYRPMNSFWRLRGMWDHLRGRNNWLMIDRMGFRTDAAVPSGSESAS